MRRLPIGDEDRTLVELPAHWTLDDAPHFWSDGASWNTTIRSAAETRVIWEEELAGFEDLGALYMLTMHPQVIARVVVLDLDGEGLAQTAEQAGAATVRADVTDEAAVAAAVARAAELLGGPPDGLVSAAGVYRIRPALELDAAAFSDVLRINTLGSFLVAREVAAQLVESDRPGAMVLLASIAHESGDARGPAAHYAASKGAIVSLVRQLAVEWAPHGIRVNAVSPGVIRTPMLRLTDDPDAARAYLDSAVPLPRLGEPEEIAAACLYLLGEGASYVTGTVLTVDGGSTA